MRLTAGARVSGGGYAGPGSFLPLTGHARNILLPQTVLTHVGRVVRCVLETGATPAQETDFMATITITSENLDETLRGNDIVLLDFWAD